MVPISQTLAFVPRVAPLGPDYQQDARPDGDRRLAANEFVADAPTLLLVEGLLVEFPSQPRCRHVERVSAYGHERHEGTSVFVKFQGGVR